MRAELERALAASTPEAVLGALLGAWQIEHHPVLAELVLAAARRADEVRPPRVLSTSVAARHAQWLAIAAMRDPLALDWLFSQFAAPRWELGMEQIAALTGWSDDPRVVLGLLELCRTRPLVTHRPLWTQIFRAIRARVAPHAAPLVAELSTVQSVTEFDVYLLQNLARISRTLASLPPLSSAPDPTLVAALEVKLDIRRDRASLNTAEDFLREIWATPNDDGPRLVFADWLTERGDPRGEMISLQLVRGGRIADADAMRRERALLAEHGREWMGALAPVVARNAFLGFERGFVYRCDVMWRRLAAAPALMTHPAWATVREYRLDSAGDRICDPWLDHMIGLGARRL